MRVHPSKDDPPIWYRIVLSRTCCFSIECEGGCVVKTAPIGRWCLGMRADQVFAYYKKRGAHVDRL